MLWAKVLGGSIIVIGNIERFSKSFLGGWKMPERFLHTVLL